ncbi:hypothetical protein [Streptomyces sp. NPDC059850]|uniref:hypothetical protein n=1 Tax=Streptomyces sp. NPDC059850 TaxID=3346970 RepID=UPI003652AE08
MSGRRGPAGRRRAVARGGSTVRGARGASTVRRAVAAGDRGGRGWAEWGGSA